MGGARGLALKLNSLWDTPLGELCMWLISDGQHAMYEQLVDEAAALAERGEVLDVGCGTGHAAVMLARRRPEVRVVGVDLAARLVALAEARARRERVDNVSFRSGDALCLSFEEARFQLVYSIDSIKHWPDQTRGVDEIHRVLAPGGTMLLAELDPSATPEAIDALARVPPLSLVPRSLLTTVFHAVTANGALRPGAARDLMSTTRFSDFTVEALVGFPLILVRARKAR